MFNFPRPPRSFGFPLHLTSFRLLNAVQYLAKFICKDVADLGAVLLRRGILHLGGTQRDPQHYVTVLEALRGHV